MLPMESLLHQRQSSPTTRTLSTTLPKPLPLERLWESLLMLPRMEKLFTKLRRERLKLIPLFSLSPRYITLESTLSTTLLWSDPTPMVALCTGMFFHLSATDPLALGAIPLF